MATFAIRPIHPVKRLDGYTFLDLPLAAAQTFEAGAPVYRDPAGPGTVAEAGTNPSLIAGFFLAAAADYAWKEDTFGTVVPSVPFATADQEFRGTFEGTFAANDVGAIFGITRHSSGVWVVDKTKSGSNQRVRITGIDDEVAVGDVNPPVRFVVIEANRQVIS
jgi:hypothetical protein